MRHPPPTYEQHTTGRPARLGGSVRMLQVAVRDAPPCPQGPAGCVDAHALRPSGGGCHGMQAAQTLPPPFPAQLAGTAQRQARRGSDLRRHEASWCVRWCCVSEARMRNGWRQPLVYRLSDFARSASGLVATGHAPAKGTHNASRQRIGPRCSSAHPQGMQRPAPISPGSTNCNPATACSH